MIRRRTALGLTLAALAGLGGGCAALGDFAPRVDRVVPRITGLDLEGVDVVFDVQGSSAVPLNASSPPLTYRLDVAGKRLTSGRGAGASVEGRRIRAELPVRVGFAELAGLLGSLRGRDEAPYELTGSFEIPALIGGGSPLEVPFSHAGTLPIPKPPKIRVQDVRTADVGLGGATLELDVELANPNGFALGLEQLGYDLTLGGTSLGGLRATTDGKVPARGSRSLTLSADVSSGRTLQALLGGVSPADARVVPTGSFDTPWGAVRLR